MIDLARRLGQSLPVLLLATVLVFLVVHLLPSDPALVIAGPDASDATIAAIRTKFGLDRPLWFQYGVWLGQVVRGDLGTSIISGLPVRALIGQALPATAELAVTSLVVIVFIALPVGLIAATHEESVFDRASTAVAAFMTGVPNFWLGILLILVFSVYLGWFPPSGRIPLATSPLMAFQFLVLPVVALTARLNAVLFLFVRTSALEVIEQDYVRTAHAKGLPSRVVAVKHVLRNALLPILTVLSVQFARLLAGAVVIETVFAWPGMGRLLVTAVNNLDYPVVQGVLLVLVSMFIVLNFATDVLYGFVDPRIRLRA